MVKYFITDVDGTLTNGKILYNNYGETSIAYSKLDGEGFARLRENGITPVWVSSEAKSNLHEERAKDLNINYVFITDNKFQTIDNFLKERNSSWEEIAYIGDDVSDLRCLTLAKYAFIPKGSILSEIFNEIPQSVITTKLKGGNGSVREAIEFILEL